MQRRVSDEIIKRQVECCFAQVGQVADQRSSISAQNSPCFRLTRLLRAGAVEMGIGVTVVKESQRGRERSPLVTGTGTQGSGQPIRVRGRLILGPTCCWRVPAAQPRPQRPHGKPGIVTGGGHIHITFIPGCCCNCAAFLLLTVNLLLRLVYTLNCVVGLCVQENNIYVCVDVLRSGAEAGALASGTEAIGVTWESIQT